MHAAISIQIQQRPPAGSTQAHPSTATGRTAPAMPAPRQPDALPKARPAPRPSQPDALPKARPAPRPIRPDALLLLDIIAKERHARTSMKVLHTKS